MVKEVKWTKYLWLSLLSFGAFMLEYLSIFVIEVIFLHVDIQNYTTHQRNIHCIIMVFIWTFLISVLLIFSRKYYHFPISGNKREKISLKNWIVILACFILLYILSSEPLQDMRKIKKKSRHLGKYDTPTELGEKW